MSEEQKYEQSEESTSDRKEVERGGINHGGWDSQFHLGTKEKEKQEQERKSKNRGLVLTAAVLLSLLVGVVSIVTRPAVKNGTTLGGSLISSSQPIVRRDGIGVIYLDGIISYNVDKTYEVFGLESESVAEKLYSDFKYYMDNPYAKAIVISIDSPGGELVACNEIFAKMKALRAKIDKPVIISFRTVAASGGYYLGMIGDEIYANVSTTTGSIGVLSEFYNVSEFMDKYGLKMYTITTGKNKAALSPFQEPEEEAIEYRRTMLLEGLDVFVGVVLESRGDRLTGNRDEIFDGRVYTGKNALKNGLIDHLGSLDDAIDKAAEIASLTDYDIIPLPRKKKTPLEYFMTAITHLKPKVTLPYQELFDIKFAGVPMLLYTPGILGLEE